MCHKSLFFQVCLGRGHQILSATTCFEHLLIFLLAPPRGGDAVVHIFGGVEEGMGWEGGGGWRIVVLFLLKGACLVLI